jgi:ABC-type multidrug transport system ATPase subunit
LINEGRAIQEKSLSEIMESQITYKLRVEVDGVMPTFPDEVRVLQCGEKEYELETRSRTMQQTLLRELHQARARILDIESREASLEDYFIEAVGHKIL